jgi:hypothetical protein
MFSKTAEPEGFYCNRLPGVYIAGESITYTNNSTNIRKNSKSFLGMSIGTRGSCWMKKKTGHEKSRDTVPFKALFLFETKTSIVKVVNNFLMYFSRK